MTVIDVYHIGAISDIEFMVETGNGLKWSKGVHDWLGGGIYFWEDLSWAEWWQSERWPESIDVQAGAILAASLSTEYLLDLGNRHDAKTFRHEAKKALSNIQGRKSGIPKNDRSNQIYALDCAIANSVKEEIQGYGKHGLRMPFHLGESLSENGNFYADQHIQICLWNPDILENVRLLPWNPDALSAGSGA